jgi:hypothetical protein
LTGTVVCKIELYAAFEKGQLIGHLREDPMRMNIAVITTMLAVLPMLLASGLAQTPQKSSTLTIAGHSGEAHLLLVNGKSYIDIEELARLTQGTLSFKSNQTTLTLPSPNRDVPVLVPHANVGFSRAFIQASIEEISVIREWRIAIINAVGTNSPVPVDWISAQQRQAEKNLALASATAATDSDRSAYAMLSVELNHMQTLSERYLAIRKQDAFISPDSFNSSSLEDQIMSCARGLVSMTESHEFKDLPACH